MKQSTYIALVSQVSAVKFFNSRNYEVNDNGMLAAQIARGDQEYLDRAMAPEITDETPINIHLLQTNANSNIGVRFIEPKSQYAMDPDLAEETRQMMATNEYRQMHPEQEEDHEWDSLRLLQTNSNVNLGVRFIEPESQYAMDPKLAEQTSNLMSANEYKSMHPNQDFEEDAPFHLVQTDFSVMEPSLADQTSIDHLVQTGFVGEDQIDDKFAGQLAQKMESNEAKLWNFSQVDTTDDFGHLYDDSPSMVQTSFVTESAQDAVDPNLPQKYAQLMNYNENRAMIPAEDAYDPSRPIHLLQTGFVSGAELEDMSLSSTAAKKMEEYEHNAMTQNLDRFNGVDINI